MYFINKGECEVLMDALLEAAAMVDDSSSKNNDNEDVLCIRYAGEIVGELAFLTAIEKRKDKKTPGVGYRNATVRAKGEVECLAVTVNLPELLSLKSRNIEIDKPKKSFNKSPNPSSMMPSTLNRC